MSEKTFLLGMNAGLYFGVSGETDVAAMTEIDNVRDTTINLEAGEADVTTRGNSGWRATAPTLRECQVEFQMVWRPGDEAFEAIKTAFLTSGAVALAVLDQKRTIADAQGPLGDFSILNFSRNESLEEAIVADVTAKLARFEEWHEVAEGTDEVTMSFTSTLTDGAGTVDLTAIPYGIGTYDGSGKQVTEVTIKNNGANSLTLGAHETNGYDFVDGVDVVIGAGDTYTGKFTNSEEIGATAKIIELTGTGAQTSTWTMKLVAAAA